MGAWQPQIPEGQAKAGVLRAITSAEAFLPLIIILRILGLESGRYHAWRRAEKTCELTDRSSCPRTSPGQLATTEVATIKNMVLAPGYRHEMFFGTGANVPKDLALAKIPPDGSDSWPPNEATLVCVPAVQ